MKILTRLRGKRETGCRKKRPAAMQQHLNRKQGRHLRERSRKRGRHLRMRNRQACLRCRDSGETARYRSRRRHFRILTRQPAWRQEWGMLPPSTLWSRQNCRRRRTGTPYGLRCVWQRQSFWRWFRQRLWQRAGYSWAIPERF